MELRSSGSYVCATKGRGIDPHSASARAYQCITRGDVKVSAAVHNSLPYPAADQIAPADTYDYIVVGAGGNGCIVANKLATDDPNAKVLLLEAGALPDVSNQNIWDPKDWTLLQNDPTLEWGYISTCQAAMYGRNVQLARCAALGGSTVHHSFLWVRGGQQSLDNWKTQYGCPGWGYSDLEPFYQTLEADLPTKEGDQSKDSAWEVALRNSYVQNNFGPWKDDYNVADQNGTSNSRYVAIDAQGKRVTLYQKYVQTPKANNQLANLTVVSGVFVNKLLMTRNTTNGTHEVYAVQYFPRFSTPSGTNLKTARATREVIMTAGGIATPQILNLSGIGDEDQLKALGLNPANGLYVPLTGVGKHLVDDVYVQNNYTTSQELPDGFMSYGIGGIIGFNGKYQVTCQSTRMPGLFNIPDEWKPGFQIGMDVHDIISRGYIRIASSSDVYGLPEINLNYLKEDADLNACVDAFKKIRQIAHSSNLDPWGPTEVMPSPDVPDSNTEALKCYIRGTSSTTFHYSGTCRMGQPGISPPEGFNSAPVVDPLNLKVYGFTNLRIMDASIFPQNPYGNPQATSYAVALRGSEMVLADHPPSSPSHQKCSTA